jgi:gamma-glutamylaminecyclotransferase
MAQTTLFVYGTLKRGMSHHYRLAEQDFVGAVQTLPRYRLFACGWHPGLVEASQDGVAVCGELWRVDERTLAELDRFEGDELFERRPIAIENCAEEVLAYFYKGDLSECQDCGTNWLS